MYTKKKSYLETNSHYNQQNYIVGHHVQMNQETCDSTYRSSFLGKECVSRKVVPRTPEQPPLARRKYEATSVAAKDWRRLNY